MISIKQTLPKGWTWVKLNHVTTVVNGTTPSSSMPEYWDGDITWITPTDLGKLDNCYIDRSDRRISKAGFESCNLTIVPPGSVILSSRAPIGYVGISKIPICTNQGCKSFVPRSDIDSHFLYYALKRAVNDLKKLGSGATFAEVSKSQLEEFEIPLPPLTRQKRIAAILNDQMAAVENARIAAKAQLDAATALPATYLRQVFPEQGGDLPEGWRWVRLGEVSNRISKGESPAWQGFDYVEEGVLFIRSENVRWGTFNKEPQVFIPHVFHTKLSRSAIRESDVLINLVGASIGRACVVPTEIGDANVNQAVAVVSCSELLLPGYLVNFVISPQTQKHFDNVQVEMARPNISLENLRDMRIPLPPMIEQKHITSILDDQMAATERLRTNLIVQLDEINALPAAVLYKAFNGEL